MAQRVASTNTNYSKFKGDLIAVSEPVINKDLLVLKLDRAQRHKEKLDDKMAQKVHILSVLRKINGWQKKKNSSGEKTLRDVFVGRKRCVQIMLLRNNVRDGRSDAPQGASLRPERSIPICDFWSVP